ncbi:MAG: hypothetical protein K0R39_512 [Symbiobacteriaceae bacterium]|nr:hypothetical protein [Symbiobacteriaceae bacterium]
MISIFRNQGAYSFLLSGVLSIDRQIIPRVQIQTLCTAYVTHRNPWVAVWWTVALPGFGHIYMGQHLKGLIYMSWEILVNHQAHLNVAIYYTITGRGDLAASVVNYDWLLVYPVFYIFAMFDAYRKCIELNGLATQERLQPQRRFDGLCVNWLGIRSLNRRSPTLAALWSAFVPGFGQLYNEHVMRAFTLMIWYFLVLFKSGLGLAAFHTMRGEFHLVMPALDFQWLLFWPSVYAFGVADAYADAVEQNRIGDDAFRWRMRKYLRNGLK